MRLDSSVAVDMGPAHVRHLPSAQIPSSLGDAWHAIPSDRFAALPQGARLHFGTRAPATLLRLELDVPRTGRWWLVSDLRTPKRFDLRLGQRDVGTFGDAYPFSLRPLKTTDLAIPLHLNAPRETLYAMVSEPYGPCDVRLRLVPEAALAPMVARKAARDAWIVGYMSAIFLVALYLWFAVRERAFGWYVLYFASALMWLVAKRGLGFQYLWPNLPELNAGISLFFAHVVVGAFTLFLVNLLKLQRHHPRQERFLIALALFQFAISPLLLFNALSGWPFRMVETLQAILPLWLLGIIVHRAWPGRDRLARKLLLAFLPLGLAMVYGTLVEFGFTAGGPAAKAMVLTGAALLENTLATLILLQEIRAREKARLNLVRDFHRKVVESSDELARELSHDLHDGVGQQIFALRMKVFAASDSMPPELAASFDERIGDLHNDLRCVSRRLHPPVLRDEGLEQALSVLCADLSQERGTAIRFECAAPLPSLPDSVATHLYRIAQESVSNALRHAQAREIVVRLWSDPGHVFLSIEDDGVGLRELGTEDDGMGLSGIRSRARAMGGFADIARRIDGGTRVAVKVPV